MITRNHNYQKHEVTIELNYKKDDYEELQNDFDTINKMIEQGYKLKKISGGTGYCSIDLIKEIK